MDKKYDSVQLELEADRRVNRISTECGDNEEEIFHLAESLGWKRSEHDTWFTASKWIAVQELKREVPEEYYPAWFGNYK